MTIDLTGLAFYLQDGERSARIARGKWHPGARLCRFILTPEIWQLAS